MFICKIITLMCVHVRFGVYVCAHACVWGVDGWCGCGYVCVGGVDGWCGCGYVCVCGCVGVDGWCGCGYVCMCVGVSCSSNDDLKKNVLDFVNQTQLPFSKSFF